MILSILESSWRLTWQPTVLALTAASTIGFAVLSAALGADQGFWVLPQTAMGWLAVAVVVRFWTGLCVVATALQMLRTDWRVGRVYWVPAPIAFEAGFVAMATTIPILACIVFLIVPGVLLAVRWSQTVVSILDGRSDWFDAVGDSWALTRGSTWPILAIWLVVGFALGVAGWLSQALAEIVAAASGWTWVSSGLVYGVRIVSSAFGSCMLAAVYYELVPDPHDP